MSDQSNPPSVAARRGATLRRAAVAIAGSRGPFAPYRLVGTAFALIILAAAAREIILNAYHPADRDFLSFWGAAQMAFAGTPALAYDNAALHALQTTVATFGGSGEMPFPYPPAYLLLVMPFGLLPFPAAMAAWSLCTLVFYLFAARRLDPQSGLLALALPAVFANAAIGQNGFVTAGIFMIGMALLKPRPFAAGLVLGCLALKPQLALLVPVALIAARQWRAIGGAAISATAILLAGFAAFGPATTDAWIHQLPLYARIGRDGLVGWSKLASVYAAARQLGVDAASALILHLLVAAAAAAAVWRVWRSKGAAAAKIAILSATAPLVSPYVFYYDGLILATAFFWLVREKLHPAILLAIWCLPLLNIALLDAHQPINFGPVAPIALACLVYRRWHSKNVVRKEQADPRNLTPGQPLGVTVS